MQKHEPVLLEEVIDGLAIKEGDVVVDATLGSGGHSRKILEKIGQTGKLLAIDLDPKNIENFKIYLEGTGESNVFLKNGNFSEIRSMVSESELPKVDAILADLGYSSDQLSDEGLGMSFLASSDLDMRLSRTGPLTAENIVNDYPEEELEKIFKEYGEEKFARRISRTIIEERKKKPIKKTDELAALVRSAIPQKFHKKIDPATKVFQALRIEVNHELENLERFIDSAIGVLSPGGRLGIISFHSLEDRLVKNNFRKNAGGCICPENFPKCVCGKSPVVDILTRRPVSPSPEELATNPRSRSAKLRICEKK